MNSDFQLYGLYLKETGYQKIFLWNRILTEYFIHHSQIWDSFRIQLLKLSRSLEQKIFGQKKYGKKNFGPKIFVNENFWSTKKMRTQLSMKLKLHLMLRLAKRFIWIFWNFNILIFGYLNIIWYSDIFKLFSIVWVLNIFTQKAAIRFKRIIRPKFGGLFCYSFETNNPVKIWIRFLIKRITTEKYSDSVKKNRNTLHRL